MEAMKKKKSGKEKSGSNSSQGMLVVSTFGAESSSDVWFGRRYVGQTQSSLIEVLVGEEMSQTHTGCIG